MVKKIFRVNPIVRKDLKVISRSMKFSWGLFAYETVLLIIFIFIMLMVTAISSYSGTKRNTEIYEAYVSFFPVIGIAQLGIISLIIPIFTASSISGERERQTLDVMLTTTISPYSIVIGKITSAVFRVMIFIVASIPLMALSFVMGGISWVTLLEYLVLAFVYAIFAGSIGTFCSAVCKKSIPAIILSYVIYGAIYGVTYIPVFIAGILGDLEDALLVFLFDLVNPVQTFLMFFFDKLSGESFFETVFYNNNYPDFIQWIFSTPVWIILSCIAQLGFTALFVWFAGLKIKPGKK